MLYSWASKLLEQPHLWEAPPVEETPVKAEKEPDWRQAAARAREAAEYAEAERRAQVSRLHSKRTAGRLFSAAFS